MREAVIVSTARTPIGKAFRGAFNDTEAPAMGGHVVRTAVERAGIDPARVEDCLMGAAAQQGTQAYNLGRLCGIAGGLPDTTAGMTVDRQCSSGLMTIATAAKSIMCNELDVAVAGGVESISLVQNKHKNSYRAVSKTVLEVSPTAYIQMIETAETVAERYGISRDAQDEYSFQSQQRTAAAQEAGAFPLPPSVRSRRASWLGLEDGVQRHDRDRQQGCRRHCPRQGREGAPDAWVEIDPAFSDGLDGITPGSEVVLLSWFHKARRNVLKLHPRDNPDIRRE